MLELGRRDAASGDPRGGRLLHGIPRGFWSPPRIAPTPLVDAAVGGGGATAKTRLFDVRRYAMDAWRARAAVEV